MVWTENPASHPVIAWLASSLYHAFHWLLEAEQAWQLQPSHPTIFLEASELGLKFGGVGRGGECGSAEGLGVREPGLGVELGQGEGAMPFYTFPPFQKYTISLW